MDIDPTQAHAIDAARELVRRQFMGSLATALAEMNEDAGDDSLADRLPDRPALIRLLNGMTIDDALPGHLATERLRLLPFVKATKHAATKLWGGLPGVEHWWSDQTDPRSAEYHELLHIIREHDRAQREASRDARERTWRIPGQQTHHVAQLLPTSGRKTRAHWCVIGARRLVVFVHGFGGHPIKTWPDFPRLLPEGKHLPPFDYVFFGYDGVQTQATNSATLFLRFLQQFLADPAALINATSPSAEKRPPFTYSRVIIASHSLGAVVTRRALLDAHRLQENGARMPWLSTIRLVFFAPAHKGAFAAALVTQALTSQPWALLNLAGIYAQYRSPLLNDLDPKVSLVLPALEAETLAIARVVTPPPGYITAQRILRGEQDRVVHNVDFGVDPPVPPADMIATDHFGVCKPRDAQHLALDAVWSQL
jgi:hypothetical protein